MLVEQEIDEEGDADAHVEEVNIGDDDDSDAHGEVPTVAEEHFIPSPTPPTPRPQPPQDIHSTSQEGDETREKEQGESVEAKKVGTSQRVETYDDTVMDDEYNLGRTIAEMDQDDAMVLKDDKVKDKDVADAVKDAKEAKVDESAQVQGRQAESQAEIYKIDMDHANKVLSMQEDKTEPAKVQEVVDIEPNEDDDVYTEATPLASNVPIVDYEIIEMKNKPYYKIIRVDETYQLSISFLTFLRNIDREDLEALWSLVKERFYTTKPKNFSDDFLLTTHGEMFEKPDAHAQIWKNQRTVHGQAKVKSWKLLESCEEPKPLKKKQQIEHDEQYARELHVELNKDINWDEAIDHVKLKAKEDPTVKRYQVLKRKPQTKEFLT
nr:hypothetical protein [Tanacetum cinerariifolium]